MPIHIIRRIAILGAISILGIVLMQAYSLRQSFAHEDSDFDQSVRVALYQVALNMARINESALPKQNLVQRTTSNTYTVNINDVIDPNILEDYLISEFEGRGMSTEFEYAVYDCESQDMVYGNFCRLNRLEPVTPDEIVIPRFDDLIYYFVVRFPSRRAEMLKSVWQNIIFSLITFLALVFFAYAIWVILRQKKLSDLQKDFINNMTHEFKTPLSSIKIAANVLSGDPTIQEDERLLRYSQIISDQNDRLNEQVEKVLNLAKLETDSFKLNLETFNAHTVIQNIVKTENMRVNENGQGQVIVENNIEDFAIEADKLHFSNVLHSMIDNAVKYCKDFPEVVVKSYRKGQNLVIDIVDNGIGINAEHMDNLFQKFYRVPTGDKHDVKGFGLGLFYVQNICEAHGWQIKVKSDVGRGSTFSLIIPDHE